MRIFLSDDACELDGRTDVHVHEPFEAFMPMAATTEYQLPHGPLLVQKVVDDLISIAVYEAVLSGEQRFGIVFDKPLLSLVFALQGNVGWSQARLPLTIQQEGTFALSYTPAGSRINVVASEGRTLLLRIDYDWDSVRKLSTDFIALQMLIHKIALQRPCSRRLPVLPVDPLTSWSIRQIFEYGESNAERSLFIYARSFDLLRNYLHSALPHRCLPDREAQSAAPQLEPIATYIEGNLGAPLSSVTLARLHHLSVRTLERRFSQQYAHSIGKYILMRRMEKAKALLAETRIQLLEIALMVGYSELTNFSRAFKAFYGYLPSRMRK